MSTRAQMAKMRRKQKMIENALPKRLALKADILDMSLTMEERLKKVRELNKMKKNTSKIRHRNRCLITGRPRGVLTKFGISRIVFREMAHRGEIPGVTKSSW